MAEEKNTNKPESFEEQYRKFQETFPIGNLKEMNLETYTDIDTEKGFSFWILNRFGNTNYQTYMKNLGIFKYKGEPKFGNITTPHGKDNTYAWQYNNNRDDAFTFIKQQIFEIATNAKEYSQNQDKQYLDNIDKIVFPPVYKWKIAFLYSDHKLIDWYNPMWLKIFIHKLQPETKLNPKPKMSELQQTLAGIRDKDYIGKPAEFREKLGQIFNDQKKDISTTLYESLDLIESTHNIILHGAPGTGKTYLAREIAKELILGDANKTLSEEEQKQLNEQIGFVQFHPSYDYTDFVEGLRPVNKNKKADDDTQIGFERKDGVFKEFCEKAFKSAFSFYNEKTQKFDEQYQEFLKDIRDKEYFILKTVQGKDFTVTVENENLNIFPQERTITKNDFITYLNTKKVAKNKQHKSYVTVLARLFNKRFSPQKYVFIIDEINRGEMSKIFGELFYSIDPGYRVDVSKIEKEKPITIRTQYANMATEPNEFDKALGIEKKDENKDDYGHFFVPDNVYIIGTMNDIDRSVESMDFAMRRRFTFKEIKAEDNIGMLDELDDETKKKAIDKMKGLNNAIEKINGLSSAYHIGAAYFLKIKDLGNDFGKLWEYHLEPLLKEYLRGQDPNGEKLKTLEATFLPKPSKNGKNQPDIPEDDDDEDNYDFGAEEQ